MQVHGTFAITAEEGGGKSLISVSKIYEYMINDRKVISNFDLYLDNLLPYWSKATYLRVPDFPTAAELWACGQATLSANESDFGLLCLDEIAVAANAREWGKDGRKELIDYFRQTRKHGFDKFFLSQGLDSIDSQIRKDLIKFQVVCRRTDSIKIPFIGGLLNMIGLKAMLPNVHVATVKNGTGNIRNALVADRWYTTGKKWFSAYDTKQKFTNDPHIVSNTPNQKMLTNTPYGVVELLDCEPKGKEHMSVGTYSVLSAWHLKGRYMSKLDIYQPAITKGMFFLIFIAFLFSVPSLFSGYQKVTKKEGYTDYDYKHADASIMGVITQNKKHFILLKDGEYVLSNKRTEHNEQYYYDYEGTLYALDKSINNGSISGGLF